MPSAESASVRLNSWALDQGPIATGQHFILNTHAGTYPKGNSVVEKLRPLVAVVDDEEAIRKALKRLLRSAGIAVECYASGPEFLRSLPVQRPDCIVLDIRMEGMNGFDVQAWLKAAHVEVPIIFITAIDGPDDQTRAMHSGAAAILRKPFGDDALLDAIAAAVRSAPTAPP